MCQTNNLVKSALALEPIFANVDEGFYVPVLHPHQKNANTVPSIPFPLDDCVFVSHLSMHFVNICMSL